MNDIKRKSYELEIIKKLERSEQQALEFIKRNIVLLPDNVILKEAKNFSIITRKTKNKIDYDKLINSLKATKELSVKKIVEFSGYDLEDETLIDVKYHDKDEENLIKNALFYLNYSIKNDEYEKIIDLMISLYSIEVKADVYDVYNVDEELYDIDTNLIDLEILKFDELEPYLVLSVVKTSDLEALKFLFSVSINDKSFYLLSEKDKDSLKILLNKFIDDTKQIEFEELNSQTIANLVSFVDDKDITLKYAKITPAIFYALNEFQKFDNAEYVKIASTYLNGTDNFYLEKIVKKAINLNPNLDKFIAKYFVLEPNYQTFFMLLSIVSNSIIEEALNTNSNTKKFIKMFDINSKLSEFFNNEFHYQDVKYLSEAIFNTYIKDNFYEREYDFSILIEKGIRNYQSKIQIDENTYPLLKDVLLKYFIEDSRSLNSSKYYYYYASLLKDITVITQNKFNLAPTIREHYKRRSSLKYELDRFGL